MGRSTLFQGVRRYRSRRPLVRVTIIAVAAVLAGLLASALWLSRADGDLPPRVNVSGVDVGGQSVEEARSLLAAHAEERLTQEITFEFPGGEYQINAQNLGLEPGLDVAIAQAEGSRSAFSRLKARLGLSDPIELTLEYSVEPRAIRDVVDEIADLVDQPMRPGSIQLIDNRIVTEDAQPGFEVDTERLFDLLRDLPERVVVPVRQVEPSITNAAIADARARAEALVTDPPDVVFRRERVELSEALMRRALTFRRNGSTIAVELEAAPLARRLRQAFARFERQPADASFIVEGDTVRIARSKVGRRLAVAATVDVIVAGAGLPEVDAVFRTQRPAFTTAKAKELGIKEVVGSFTTEFACCPPRVTNIQRAAQILTGTIIGPGETFSLNEELGERTKERGFVEAPMIGEGGKLVDAVGGGVSQIATTVFNAAFFSGLELITHTPHSFYISRYPEGREATVSWGGPELVFRNDWPSAIYVRVGASDTAVTVTFYSTKHGRRVETTTGERFDPVPAETIEEKNPDLEPGERNVLQTGGTPGFSVAYTRKVYRGEELLRDESWVTRYDPANTIVEVGPKKKKKKPPEDPASAPGGETDPAPDEEQPTGDGEPAPEDAPPTEPPPAEAEVE